MALFLLVASYKHTPGGNLVSPALNLNGYIKVTVKVKGYLLILLLLG
ncbi:MAG: hypothetical protein IKW85_13865 [Muribaculaceae bacterium]|nr:hypothetical protein [Muribaculaceae bacterium]